MFALYVRRREKPWRHSPWRKKRERHQAWLRVSFDVVATSDDYDELVVIARRDYGGRKNRDWFIRVHSGSGKPAK